MKIHSLFPMLAGCIALVMSAQVSANTQTFSSTVSYFHDNSFSSGDGSGSGVFLDDIDLTGLSRFDPALGTLNSITLSLSGDFVMTADLTGFGPTMPGEPGFAEVSGLSGYGFELVVWDSTTGSGHSAGMGFTDVFSIDSVFCEELGGECSDILFETASINSSDDITGVANLDDFIGTGPLDSGRISFGVAYPETLDFFLDNMDSAILDVSIENALGPINVTLSYDFTPVPLPGALWLLASACGLLLSLNRRSHHLPV